MNYPTIEQVEQADLAQLTTWHQALPSPGNTQLCRDAAEPSDWGPVIDMEFAILRRIIERIRQLGGFITPPVNPLEPLLNPAP